MKKFRSFFFGEAVLLVLFILYSWTKFLVYGAMQYGRDKSLATVYITPKSEIASFTPHLYTSDVSAQSLAKDPVASFGGVHFSLFRGDIHILSPRTSLGDKSE